MSPVELPDNVARFLRAHVRSLMQLEMLMLLRREPERWWSVGALDKELRSSLEASMRNLQSLVNAGFVEADVAREGFYRYRPQSEHEPALAQLAELLKTHFHVVLQVIYTGRRQVEQFANAFKLKKNGGKDDG